MYKFILAATLLLLSCGKTAPKEIVPVRILQIGDKVDSLHGVYVYYNGSFRNVGKRNVAPDGYNIGLKYQCVEFVKRFYYEYLHHKMPETYGDAKDFFNPVIKDGGLNKQRNLLQFTNPSFSHPQPYDIIVMRGGAFNPFGHVCIVSETGDDFVEIIQQNPGPGKPSRLGFSLVKSEGRYLISNPKIMGWLRKK